MNERDGSAQGVWIAARHLPAPVSVSPEARAALATLGEAMPHGGFMGAPEDREIDAEMRAFARRAWAGALAT